MDHTLRLCECYLFRSIYISFELRYLVRKRHLMIYEEFTGTNTKREIFLSPVREDRVKLEYRKVSYSVERDRLAGRIILVINSRSTDEYSGSLDHTRWSAHIHAHRRILTRESSSRIWRETAFDRSSIVLSICRLVKAPWYSHKSTFLPSDNFFVSLQHVYKNTMRERGSGIGTAGREQKIKLECVDRFSQINRSCLDEHFNR